MYPRKERSTAQHGETEPSAAQTLYGSAILAGIAAAGRAGRRTLAAPRSSLAKHGQHEFAEDAEQGDNSCSVTSVAN
jgi:hypothetical protein